MLFMVRLNVKLPSGWGEKEIEEIYAAEGKRGRQLMNDGKILRIWRIVGKRANFGIWQADSLEELHDNIQSLPLHRYMDVEVTPIIKHPATEAYKQEFDILPEI